MRRLLRQGITWRLTTWLLGLCSMAGVARAASSQPWQLTFQYTAEGVECVRAQPFGLTHKRWRTPGLAGAPWRLNYELQWLDAQGQVLHAGRVEIPLGNRVFVNDPQGGQTHPTLLPNEGAFVLRVWGPAAAQGVKRLRLVKLEPRQPERKTDAGPALGFRLPAAFEAPALEVALPSPPPRSARAKVEGATGPIAVHKLRDNGPDDNRLVLVVLAEGYTLSDLQSGSFSNLVQRFFGSFFGTSPWSDYIGAVNVYAVDVVSAESGADYEDASPEQGGTQRDTYFDAHFYNGGVERCLYLTSAGINRAYQVADDYVGAGVWDELLVFVNSAKYGGCGGAIGVSSAHRSSDEVQIHEMGHSFAGLADEYETGSSSTNCVESSIPNVDCGTRFPHVKWDVWVEPGTPIPTPESPDYAGVVGAFEGARYQARGIYRPMLDCKMRTLDREFCAVCKETLVLELFDRIQLMDGASPRFGRTDVLESYRRTFTVQTPTLPWLTYEWRLDGVRIDGATNHTLALDGAVIRPTGSTLEVVVRHNTPLVRSRVIEQRGSWQLHPVGTPRLAFDDLLVPEPDDGVTNPALTLRLPFALPVSVWVNYTTVPGTAAAGVDYVPVAGTVEFPPGQTEAQIFLVVTGDIEAEGDEVFFVNLSTTNALEMPDRQAAVVIQDNDQPPLVRLTDPQPESTHSLGASVTLSAEAVDPDDEIQRVDFLVDGALVGQVQTEPWQMTWRTDTPGWHELVAVAWDQAGHSVTSSPVRVVVLNIPPTHYELVALTNAWKYDASVADLGTNWIEPEFDDSSWSGPALALFYNETRRLPGPMNTTVPLRDGNQTIRGYYFRTRFLAPDPLPPGLTLTARALIDDGAVFYLNGTELGRLRMPAGPISRTTLASATPPGGDATEFDWFNWPGTALVPGENVLAAEVHQRSVWSSDVAFGLQVEADAPVSPELADDGTPAILEVLEGRPVTFHVLAGGSEPLTYQWFRDNAPLPFASDRMFTIPSARLTDAGAYACQVSNIAGVTWSRTTELRVARDTAGPRIVQAVADWAGTSVEVQFSENVDPSQATRSELYLVKSWPDGDSVPVHSVVSRGDDRVKLLLDGSLSEGDYVVVAGRVSDVFGNRPATEQQAPVRRQTRLVAADEQAWRYFALDRAPDAGWNAPGFDDAATPWQGGAALFAGDVNGAPTEVGPDRVPVGTILSLINPPGAPAATRTFYFRTTFQLETLPVPKGSRLWLRALVDDGAIFYLNGHEVQRVNLPSWPGTVDYTTLALSNRTDAEAVFQGPSPIETHWLRTGTNVLAAEVHQADSADMAFAAELLLEVPGPALPPRLYVSRFGDEVLIEWDEAKALLEAAPTVDGTWQIVAGPTTNAVRVPASAPSRFYRLRINP